MARQSQNKFIKRQKELERMRKAKEKMLRRQGKKDRVMEPDEAPASGEPADQPWKPHAIEYQQFDKCP